MIAIHPSLLPPYAHSMNLPVYTDNIIVALRQAYCFCQTPYGPKCTQEFLNMIDEKTKEGVFNV